MGTTTVKIRTEDKERLDMIKAKLVLKGKKMNQEELLGKIISIIESHPLLLDDDDFSVDEKTRSKLLDMPRSMGSGKESEIDQILYGDIQ